jgi:hypothetical protein
MLDFTPNANLALKRGVASAPVTGAYCATQLVIIGDRTRAARRVEVGWTPESAPSTAPAHV